jgi:hypothetical protein
LAPLILQSGTNLSTPATGAVEFDGKVVYSTPVNRGVSPSIMFYRLNSDYVGSNINTAQAMFGVGVTLAASTVYSFEWKFILSKTAGTTSHNVSLSFGGSSTINNIFYSGPGALATATLPIPAATAAQSMGIITATSTVITANGSTATRVHSWQISGTVSINASGTFIPQYTLSAAPGGAYTTIAGSYFAIWPIGAAGANTSVGPWA